MCDLRCFEQVGLYDVKKRHTQDADMLLRLARAFPFVRVPEKLTYVRDHGTRDSKRPTFVAEAGAFFRGWLDALTPLELSARPSGFARAMSRKEIAGVYLSRASEPWTGLARNQYWKAIGESPLALPVVVGSYLVHYFQLHRYSYRIGVRSYLRRRLGPVFKAPVSGRAVREESRRDDGNQDCV